MTGSIKRKTEEVLNSIELGGTYFKRRLSELTWSMIQHSVTVSNFIPNTFLD